MPWTSRASIPMQGPMVRRDLTSCPRPGLSRVIYPCCSQNSASKIVRHLHLHIHFGSRSVYLTIPVKPRVTWLDPQATLKLQGRPPYIFLKRQCFPLQLITHPQADHETAREFCRLETLTLMRSPQRHSSKAAYCFAHHSCKYQLCACSSNSDSGTPP